MAGPVTKFTSVGVISSPTNNSNGLYAPQLTSKQITNIPIPIKKNGGIWYNQDTGNLEAVVKNVAQIVQVGPGGQGDVVGPNSAIKGNIAIFNDTTGKLIADSGVDIAQVPSPLSFSKSSNSFDTPNITVNEIGNLGHIKFTNSLGLIFVDTLMPVEFITNTYKTFTQVCSLFTDGLPSSSTSPSALVEIQSDSGALLLSRMTTTERNNNLSTPPGANGMLLFNTTTKTFDGFDGANWRVLPQLNTDGTLTAADPVVSANLTTKNYVDTSIATPAAAKYIIQVANASLPNAQVLGSLANGLLKNATTTGVLSIAIAGTDYYSPGYPTTILDNSINFFIGTSAGNLTTTSTSSTGVGITALKSLTTGIDNTGIGNASLKSTTTGASNSSYGARSLVLNITGSYNSGFGVESLYNNTDNNNSAFGYQSLKNNISGTNNCAFGYQSLINNLIGYECSAFGVQALQNSNAQGNSAFGYMSMQLNTSGSLNSSFGWKSLAANTTGSLNTAIGSAALQALTTGSSNVACGVSALLSITTSSYNSAFGAQALFQTTTGQFNTAVGFQSLGSNGLGNNNTALGYRAGYNQILNDNCLFLGYQADSSVNGLTNAIAIGYQSSVGASNCMVLGGTGPNAIFVGIGITPNAQFQLPTIHANRKIVLYETANNNNQVYGFGTTNGIFNFQIDSTASNYQWSAATSSAGSNPIMWLTGTGFLGIGTIFPHAPLQFSRSFDNRKIVLYETTNNDHQVYGFGVNSGILRFQVDSISSNYIWYAGTSNTTSNELMSLTGAGYLGIGTSSPKSILSIGNPSTATGNPALSNFYSTTQGSIRIALTGQENYQSSNTSTNGIGINLGVNRPGNRQLWITDTLLSINALNPAIRLALLNGKAQIGGISTDGTTPLPLYVIGEFYVDTNNVYKPAGGSWLASSDKRVKKNITKYTRGLKEILDLEPVKFQFNDDSDFDDKIKNKINIGFIADEVEKIMPECVSTIPNKKYGETRSLDVSPMTHALINAVKELNNEITTLKQQMNN